MIYFIQSSDGPIKIGRAKSPKERVNQLQVGSHATLSLLGVMETYDEIEWEKLIQNMFSEYHLRGEWYRPDEGLLLYIKTFAMPAEDGDKWAKLCHLQPKLLDLFREVKAIKDDGLSESFCAHDHWYGIESGDYGLRGKLIDLVGYYAKNGHPEIKTSMMYDLAYDTVYNALPNCRNCGCLDLIKWHYGEL